MKGFRLYILITMVCAGVLASHTYAGRHVTSRDIRTNSATETHVRYEAGLDVHRRQGQDCYYVLTHLYSVSGLADADGKVIERYRYDAYGQPTRLVWADFNGDGRVDLRDFLIFQTAFRGPAVAYSRGGVRRGRRRITGTIRHEPQMKSAIVKAKETV